MIYCQVAYFQNDRCYLDDIAVPHDFVNGWTKFIEITLRRRYKILHPDFEIVKWYN